MTHTPDRYYRRLLRLPGYDYSQKGAYFVTLCTQNRECLLGEIMDGRMQLNDVGRIVESVWYDLPEHYPHVTLDVMTIMPNHVHAIIVLVGAGFKPAPTEPASTTQRHGLSEIVRAWKTFSSRRINETRRIPGTRLWQRNYYEHVIRDDEDLNRIRQYIINNPARWEMDRNQPDALPVTATIQKNFEELGV